MKQQDFMTSLSSALENFGVENVNDILRDYEEHFTHGMQSGKTEEEISTKLGNPNAIAKAYETDALIKKIKNPASTNFQWEAAFRVIGRLLVLAPFNFILFLIPGILIFSFLATGWSVAVGIGAASVGLIGLGVKAGLIGISLWLSLAVGSASLAVLGAAVFAVLIMFFITKFIMIGLIHYMQWNVKFVLEK